MCGRVRSAPAPLAKATAMIFCSVTRLRLRSFRYLPPFVYYAVRSARQARSAEGNLSVVLRKTGGLTFWTMTAWRDEAAMLSFRGATPHRRVMVKLAKWCDEAAYAHWVQQDQDLPDWKDGTEKLRTLGNLSRVMYPSPRQRAGRIPLE
jgi:heme-degrading monooxygenase HmoA